MPPNIPVTLVTSNSQGFVDRIYNNVVCVGGSCSFSSGGSISFASVGAANATADFTLEAGGQLAGSVTARSDGQPIAFPSITIYNATGLQVGFASADGMGFFTSPGLPAGSYFVKAQTFVYIAQLFNDIACAPCDVTSGAAVNVTVGNTTQNVNFALDQAGAISGTITDATDFSGIQNANVQVYTTGGVFITSTNTGVGGTYTLTGLGAGSYVIKISGPFNGIHIAKLYTTSPPGGVTCINCDVTGGAQVSVTLGSTATGISVALQRGGTITGTVTANAGGAPIVGLSVSVLNSTGGSVASATTNGAGVYSIGGLVAGTYYVRTNSSSTLNFIPEIYAGVGNHVTCISCPVSSGTPLSVTLGASQTANFSLLGGATISGIVTTASGTPVQGNGTVQLSNNVSSFSIATASTDGTGTYNFRGLPAGTYFVRTNAGQALIDEVYNDIACVGCTASGGTPIVLAAGETRNDIHFALVVGGRITGRITNVAGSPLASGQGGFVSVNIHNASGGFVTSASTNAAGVFLTTVGLATGNYFAVSSNGIGYINTLYNDISCVSCSTLTGAPIAVTAGNTTTGIDLVLRAGGSLSGMVFSSDETEAELEPIPNAIVQIYSSAGSQVTTATTNSAGAYTAIGLPTDNYTVKTSNGVGFIDELFNNAVCMGCDVTSGTPVPVTVGSNTPNVNFILRAGGAIAGTVTDASSNPLAGITVQVHNNIGGFITSALTQFDGTYSLRGLSTGQDSSARLTASAISTSSRAAPTSSVAPAASRMERRSPSRPAARPLVWTSR